MRVSDLEDLYDLSPAQQGILFHCVLAPESSVYISQSIWSMNGLLDVPRFLQAWQVATDRHAALRSALYWEGLDTPQQAVFRGVSCVVEVGDWRGSDSGEHEARMQALLAHDRSRGFQLKRAPLSRVVLRQSEDRLWRCLWSRHHILFDGWSQAVVLRDVFAAYAAGGDAAALQPVTPYASYIAWLKAQDRSRAAQFWNALFDTKEPSTPLRTLRGYRQPAGDVPAPKQETIALSTGLEHLLRVRGLTVTAYALGLWALVLSRLTSSVDVVFGVTVSGRPPALKGVESMVGLFINTLPLKVNVVKQEPFASLIRRVMVRQAEIAEYSYCSVAEIQLWSSLSRREPLFETVVVADNYPKQDFAMASLCGLELSGLDSSVQNNYALTLRVGSGEGSELQLLYDSNRVDPGLLRVLLMELQTLVQSASDLVDFPLEAADQILERAEHDGFQSASRSIFAGLRRRAGNQERSS